MKLVAIEGLMGYDSMGINESFPYVAGHQFDPITKLSDIMARGNVLAMNLIKPLAEEIKDLDFTIYDWDDPPDQEKLQGADIIVGHGFGAAWMCGRFRMPTDAIIITIDPRFTGFDNFKNFTLNKTWHNFYQRTGGLSGNKVDNTDNNLLHATHTGIMALPQIKNLILDFIKMKVKA